MTLRMLLTKGGQAVFTFEDDMAVTTVTIQTSDDQETILAKLAKLISLAKPAPEPPRSWLAAPERAVTSASIAAKLEAPRPAFTGAPVITPPDLSASIAQANATGWEMYTGDED